MSQRLQYGTGTKKGRKNKPVDWVCMLCTNYNYSFRVLCKVLSNLGNRCHIQSRDLNQPPKMKEEPALEIGCQIVEPETKCEQVLGLQFPQMVFLAIEEEQSYEEGEEEMKYKT